MILIYGVSDNFDDNAENRDDNDDDAQLSLWAIICARERPGSSAVSNCIQSRSLVTTLHCFPRAIILRNTGYTEIEIQAANTDKYRLVERYNVFCVW